jgi:hypothetical protein
MTAANVRPRLNYLGDPRSAGAGTGYSGPGTTLVSGQSVFGRDIGRCSYWTATRWVWRTDILLVAMLRVSVMILRTLFHSCEEDGFL